MSLHFDALFAKKVQKVPHFVKKHEKPSIWPKLAIFRGNYHVLAFSWTFQKEVAKGASFRGKAREIIDLAKTCNFSKKLPCFYVSMNFMAKSWKNCLISWKSTKTHRFGQSYHTFSNKLPCFGVSMNFWAKGCKKLLNSWKSTKNHRFCKNFLTFRTNYRAFAFRWTFPEKVAKSASFREKARKIVDLAKTRNFSNKLPCFDALVNFSAKSCRKCLVFWENSKTHRLGQNLQLFRTKYHVYAFRWTFQQKVAKSASFREKARKIIDLAKTCNFSNKLPCFGISMNFSGKKCKKWPVSWKSTNTHRFGQNLQLLEETTMFWHFDDYCRKKLQKGEKVAPFVKNDEKSSIWPKLATFRGNYHVSAFLSTFQQKVSHFVKKHEKSSFGSCLAHS